MAIVGNYLEDKGLKVATIHRAILRSSIFESAACPRKMKDIFFSKQFKFFGELSSWKIGREKIALLDYVVHICSAHYSKIFSWDGINASPVLLCRTPRILAIDTALVGINSSIQRMIDMLID